MKIIVSAILISCSWLSALADPVLLGRWQSDREMTMHFAKQHAKLEEKTLLFLDQMMGRLTLVFLPTRISSEMPNWQSETAEGIKSQLVGFRELSRYKIVGSTAEQIATISIEPLTGQRRITVYNFENKDTMWVYVGGSAFSNMNIREYFVRIK